MTNEKHVNGKELLINGSVNPSLSPDELLQFDMDSKRHAIHLLQIRSHYPGHTNEIEKDVFEPLSDLYSLDQINALENERDINEALETVLKRVNDHQLQMIMKTESLHFELGKQIFDAKSKLKFGGEFKLTKGQILGFISCVGNCNGFNVDKVSHSINFLHNNAPRRNCGINNVNSGQLMHAWSIESDYIYMNLKYCYVREVKVLQEWFNSVKHVQQLANADSFRLQVDDAGDGGFYVRLVMWWD